MNAFRIAALLSLALGNSFLRAEDDKVLLPWSGDRTITLHIGYTLSADPGTERIVFKAHLPDTIKGRQKILAVNYTHKPKRVYKAGDGRYVEWRFESLKDPVTLGIDIKVSTWRFDLGTARRNPPAKPAPPAELERWLKPEPLLESNDPNIKAAAAEITATERSQCVGKIIDKVVQRLEIGRYDIVDRGASWAWSKKRGDCSEYSDLFIALCRARGIPARFCAGYATHLDSALTMKHGWAEAYFPKLGWVPFDPILLETGDATMHALPNGYLLLDHQRRNRELRGYQFMGFSARGGRLQVKESLRVTRHDVE